MNPDNLIPHRFKAGSLHAQVAQNKGGATTALRGQAYYKRIGSMGGKTKRRKKTNVT